MSEATTVEVLLALLTVTVGLVTFYGATRANRAQSETAVIAIDAQAYKRAQEIYESAIATFEKRVSFLEAKVDKLDQANDTLVQEMDRLYQENRRLRKEIRNQSNGTATKIGSG